MIKQDIILEKNLYPRELLPLLERDLNKRESLLILGSRRAGKTSLLLLLAKKLLSKGERVSFFDLENPDDLDIVAQGPEVLKKFTGGGFVFIDEIHYLEDPAKLIKLTVDHFPGMKIICTGSSSLAIYLKYRDSLIGRAIEYELFPLNFREFLTFKGESYLNLLPSFDFRNPEKLIALKYPEKIERFFEEYVLYGGYPESVLAEGEDKKSFLARVFRIYAKRDLKDFYSLREEKAFERFFYTLASRTASLLNLNEISKELGISFKTLKNYLFLLENLFLVKILSPFSTKLATSIKKMPKVYFVDTGLLCWAFGNFEALERRKDAGYLIENSVFISLLNNLSLSERIYYFRKKSGNEIDFIIKSEEKAYGLEVKWRKHPEVNKNQLKLLNALNIQKFILLSKNTLRTEMTGTCPVYVIPAFLV